MMHEQEIIQEQIPRYSHNTMNKELRRQKIFFEYSMESLYKKNHINVENSFAV